MPSVLGVQFSFGLDGDLFIDGSSNFPDQSLHVDVVGGRDGHDRVELDERLRDDLRVQRVTSIGDGGFDVVQLFQNGFHVSWVEIAVDFIEAKQSATGD